MPALQRRPLPPALQRIPLQPDRGDYLDRIEPTLLGYLLWSRFPLQVYVASKGTDGTALTPQQAEIWQQATDSALQEWGTYLPLERSLQPESADILIRPQRPPLQITRDPDTGRRDVRARAGETRYQFYWRRDDPGEPPILAHRTIVDLAPTVGRQALEATARHEMGHALGLWGHSDDPADALYPRQVRDPMPISARDLNTLIRLYQQPSRLGGTLAPTAPTE